LLLLEDLPKRGVEKVGLFVTDGNDGLLAALAQVFPATPRQRCLLHIQRAVTSAIPKGERGKIWSELSGIWRQPTKAEAQDQLLAFKEETRQKWGRFLEQMVCFPSNRASYDTPRKTSVLPFGAPSLLLFLRSPGRLLGFVSGL
jgi:transposase-like protein